MLGMKQYGGVSDCLYWLGQEVASWPSMYVAPVFSDVSQP